MKTTNQEKLELLVDSKVRFVCKDGKTLICDQIGTLKRTEHGYKILGTYLDCDDCKIDLIKRSIRQDY
jgi:aspartyl aminopeptidase